MRTAVGESLYANLGGHANLTLSENSSDVVLHVWGLSPNTDYAAHVHNDVCANGGGGHYLHAPEGEDIAENGLWPALQTNGDGEGTGIAMQSFVVTEDARSVVVHEPGTGDRLACADLISSPALMGMLNPTAEGANLYPDLAGHAYVSVSTKGRSQAEISVTGLNGDEVYPAHVHLEECATGGGAHYLQDTAGEDVAANGLWPMVHVNGFAYGAGWATNPFTVRSDETRSVVIHQPVSGERIACADLTSTRLAFRSGPFNATETGVSLYGENAIEGRASISITPEGQSAVSLYVSGLTETTQYAAHVHNGICETGGGGHYLQVVNGEDTSENGLWPAFTTDSDGVGVGQAMQNFIVRNDARSVVIHEPESGDRIACADLM